MLTRIERDALKKFFTENPDGGYKAACRFAGIVTADKADAKRIVESDDEVSAFRERQMGVDLESALIRIGRMAADLGHKDAFRANTFIAGALHGVSEQQRVQLAGDPDHPIGVTAPDVDAAVERFTAAVAAATLRNAPAGREADASAGAD